MLDAFNDLGDAIDGSWWSYAVVWLVALLDSVFPVVPSESLVILAGVLSADGTMRLPLVIACGAAGAVMGDNLSYTLGRRFGPWITRHLFSGRRAPTLAWAERQLQARGKLLVITSRFVPGGRTAVTLTSGITNQPRAGFFVATVMGGLIWASYAALLGNIGGQTFKDNHLVAFLVAFGCALSVTALIEVVRARLRRRRARALGVVVEGDLPEARSGSGR